MSYKFTCEEDIGCIAAPVHTDSSFITILQADECAGGLQIIDANGDFIDVDPLPGTFFVNMGDMGKVIIYQCIYYVYFSNSLILLYFKIIK